MAWKVKALKWCGWSSGALLLLLFAAGIALFMWAAKEYSRYRPLDLTDQVAKVGIYILPDGMALTAGKALFYFDDGPVLDVSGLGVRGADGRLGVFVEQAHVKFATTQLLLLSAAPKMVEAEGVTLRLVRSEEGIFIAGLALGESRTDAGIVDWLNGLHWSRVWGRLKHVHVNNLNLLVRDDVQQAEWVLEDGDLVVSRYPDDGERGTLTAMVRRLYGDEDALKLDNIPVLVEFQHKPGANDLEISGKLEGADAAMVADYLPPKFQDILQAKGEVEVGTRVLEGNKLELPWVTLKLKDATVAPGEHLFSQPLTFPKLDVTLSYVPPAVDISPSDMLLIRNVTLTTKDDMVVNVSGTIRDLQGDMLIDLSLASEEGDFQGAFDFFPDKPRGLHKALEWLRPNIEKGRFENLTAHYKGKPSDFPGCGEHCGTLDIDGRFTDGRVRFLDEITPVEASAGRIRWRGQTLTVFANEGVIQGTGGTQKARNVVVTLDKIFEPAPTELRVTAALTGPASGLMAELNKLDGVEGKIPLGIGGRHSSLMDILVPLPRGEKASFATSTVQVSSSIVDVSVKNLPQLKGLNFEGALAAVNLDAAKRLRVQTEGKLGGHDMAVDWSQNIAPNQPDQMQLKAKGFVTGDWLMKHVSTTFVTLDGLVGVSAQINQQADDAFRFAVAANGVQTTVAVPPVKYTKPAGAALTVDASGLYAEDTRLTLEKLDVRGRDLSVGGGVDWYMNDPARSTLNLPKVKLGQSDVSVQMVQGRLAVNGKLLDVSGYDLFGAEDAEDGSALSDMTLNLDVATLRLKGGAMNTVKGVLQARDGGWRIEDFSATLDDGKHVNIRKKPLEGQGGRSRMTLALDDLGRTLQVIGLYDQLKGGRMTGEINYDRDDVGGGVVHIRDFELKNPSVFVQLLSLLSLEQLLSGASSTMFKEATIPLRVDGGVWTLDNAVFDGPSMTIRLNGVYDANANDMNFDGKLTPAIPLNRLIGKIPLLGTLLTGSQDGVVVADFKLKGKTSNPEIHVRPLSVITPGLLKDIFK